MGNGFEVIPAQDRFTAAGRQTFRGATEGTITKGVPAPVLLFFGYWLLFVSLVIVIWSIGHFPRFLNAGQHESGCYD